MYQVCVWIHILMAMTWVGGLIYTAAIVVPLAVRREPAERQRMLREFGRRFRWIGWGAVAIAIITGLGNLTLRYSPIKISQLFNGQAFEPGRVDEFMAIWLPWKLALVALMIVLMAFHDITSIRAARRYKGDRETAPGNRAGSLAAALATLIAFAVVYVSVRLVRG
jgi:putative copper resistance protein D